MHSGDARLMDDTAMGLSLHTCQKNIEKNLRVICVRHRAHVGGWQQGRATVKGSKGWNISYEPETIARKITTAAWSRGASNPSGGIKDGSLLAISSHKDFRDQQ
jgi:hypothetical protein